MMPALILLAVLIVLAVVVTVLGRQLWKPGPTPPPPGGMITVGPHRKVQVTERPGEDPAIVFIHGLPGSIRDWDNVQSLLPERHLIAIDRPGFGDSGGSPLTMREQADVIAEALKALSVERALLVGHSYGGTVALTVARRHPGAVGGVVLVAPMGGGRRMPIVMRNEARALLVVALPVLGDVLRRTIALLPLKVILRRAYRRAFDPSAVGETYWQTAYSYSMRGDTLRSLYANRVDFNRDFGWLDRHLDEVEVPVGIVRAVDDAMVGSWSAVGLRDYLPNVVSFEECDGGHMIPYTRPVSVHTAVTAVTESMLRIREEEAAAELAAEGDAAIA
jgi:pimeloyl-ACP methyl ester carboxylesterase